MRWLTDELPGTGGALKTTPEDFVVEEIPAYSPSGEGTHTFVFVEKRGLTTEEALQRLCRAFGVPRDAAGAAGMKDRHAVTRQWLSFPDVAPEKALASSTPELRVIEAARHGNKLKTGHLRGNRFTLTLRGTNADALSRARAIVESLAATGMPNRFGQQRFGARGDNASRGRALVTGEPSNRGAPPPRSAKPPEPPSRPVSRSEKRLLVSAFQSELFNAYLDQRIADGLLRSAIAGDILRKRETGGLFVANESELLDARARLDAGTLDVTGPMVGHKTMSPPEGTPSALREEALLVGASITRAQLAKLGPIAEGTRRPLTVPIGEPVVEPGPTPDSLVLRFSLPSGSYATVLADEIVKPQ